MNNKKQDDAGLTGRIAVYDMPLVKGKPIPGVFSNNPETMSQYYIRVLEVESGYHERMINSVAVDYPPLHIRILDRLSLDSRESRRGRKKKNIEKILDIYQKKEKWLRDEIAAEEEHKSPLTDVLREIENAGFGVGVINGNPCIYEVDSAEQREMPSSRMRLQGYYSKKRQELSVKLAKAMTLFEEENPLEEIDTYIGELRQARMIVNGYITILKRSLRDLEKAKSYYIKLARIDKNGRNI